MLQQNRIAGLTAKRWEILAVGLFFTLLLAGGLLLYQDYGVAWDESTQVEMGFRVYRYVMKHDPGLLSWHDRYYGSFFEILLVMLQAQGASREMYLSRHLLNFLCFYAGVVAFFLLGQRFFRSTWAALLGCVLLGLSPRIFADAFYNSKDIPCLALYIWALLTMLWFLDRPAPLTTAAHSLFTAALVATRLPGLLIPALTLGGLLVERLIARVNRRRALANGASYIVAASALTILFWPGIWPDPAGEFLQALRVMSSFPHETGMLYLGQQINSSGLPWHYIPVWIAVTTPLITLALFGIGLFSLITRLAGKRSGWFERAVRDDLLILSALFVPLLMVIGLGSTLYDGWRQMYFISAPFVLIAIRGATWTFLLLQHRLPSRLAGGLLAAALLAGLLPTAAWMAANHPYQNLFFNRLAGPDMRTIQQRFMLDYWGLTYREGLRYILENDPSPSIPVFVETSAGQRNAAIFPTAEEKRLRFVSVLSEAKYFIGNYYREPNGYFFEREVYTIWVGNAKILSVYLLTDEDRW